MSFDLQTYYSALNHELWVAPFLILIILLNFIKEGRIRKVLLVVIVSFLVFITYDLFLIFKPISSIPEHLTYLVKYPYGFIFLFLYTILIVNIFYKNKLLKYFSILTLFILCLNQINQRLSVNQILGDYSSINDGKTSLNILEATVDTIEDSPISNTFGFENTFWRHNVTQTNVFYSPYLNIAQESFYNFKFPNYYWTSYNQFFNNNYSIKLNGNFVPPVINEEVSLRSSNTVNEFFLVMSLNENGELLRYSIFPDKVKLININKYLNTIKVIPAHYNGKAVAVTYYKKYTEGKI